MSEGKHKDHNTNPNAEENEKSHSWSKERDTEMQRQTTWKSVAEWKGVRRNEGALRKLTCRHEWRRYQKAKRGASLRGRGRRRTQ
eukprot:5471769-Alexandrium_andersonii.AAC.1